MDPVAALRSYYDYVDGEAVSFGFADFQEFSDEGKIARRWTYTDLGTV